MHIRYQEFFQHKFKNVLYNSMVEDTYRRIITRWRLSSHKLFIETGRYIIPCLNRNERKCLICNVIEDKSQTRIPIRMNLLKEYNTVESLLSPKKGRRYIANC